MSRQLNVVPGWPEPARSIMYSAFSRQTSANAAARSTGSTSRPATRRHSSSGT